MNMALKNAKLVPMISDRGTPVLLVLSADGLRQLVGRRLGIGRTGLHFLDWRLRRTGKDGIAYPIKTAEPGRDDSADLANPKANCAKLAAPPVWLTMSPGPVDPCPDRSPYVELFSVGRFRTSPHDTRAVL